MAVRLLNIDNNADNNSTVSTAATSTETLENAGTYAGLLVSLFMIGRTLTTHLWGILADAYGRRWTLLVSLVLSLMGSIDFGMTSTYFGAVVARFVLGACNSTMTTEVMVIAVADSAHEIYGSANGSKTLETCIVGAVVPISPLTSCSRWNRRLYTSGDKGGIDSKKIILAIKLLRKPQDGMSQPSWPTPSRPATNTSTLRRCTKSACHDVCVVIMMLWWCKCGCFQLSFWFTNSILI